MKVRIKGLGGGGGLRGEQNTPGAFWQAMKGRFSSSCQLGADGGTTAGPTPSRSPQESSHGASPVRPLSPSPLQSRRDLHGSRASLLLLWTKGGKENCP